MPPVRWKPLPAVAVLCLLQGLANCQMMQDAISMTSDGWRPIVGTHKEPPTIYHNVLTNNNEYRTQTIATSTTPVTPLPLQTVIPTKPPQQLRQKIPPHSKIVGLNPFFGLTSHGSHGPVIPLGSVTHGRPGQSGHIKKFPLGNNNMKLYNQNKRQNKPIRLQTTNHGNREEMFTASASSGAYSAFNKGANKIKTRETAGLGLPQTPSGGYTINQPHAHIEFNRFAAANNDPLFHNFGQPVQGFIFHKHHPQINDINTNFQFQKQADDFTRNLVPPPPRKHNYKQVEKSKPTTEKAHQQQQNHPDNIIVQLPPPFQYSQQLPPNNNIQVTKEKLKVFHNNIPADYLDYEFHNLKIPTETVPKHQTYEVTEGKPWEETPQPYVAPPRRRKPVNKRPEIELNYPPFLPTPYSAEGQAVVPTSPTQSEVSTIFTKLSTRQKDREIVTQNPNAYNVKEVSTHYPILGKPIFEEEPQTEEITNDITTTTTTTTRPRRRRPGHRTRPTTTSTTETPEEEVQEETEKPIRQRRPSHRHRTTSTTPTSLEEDVVKVSRVRGRYRIRDSDRRRTTTTTTEVPDNHKMSSVSEEYVQSTEAMSRESIEDEEEEESTSAETLNKVVKFELEMPADYELKKKIRFNVLTPVVEKVSSSTEPTTIISEPDNEIETLTSTEFVEPTTTTTTTTLAPTTTLSKRIRGRPFKYDNSNRPRFSVKDYRQKLSTTSTTTSTEAPKIADPLKTRVGIRLRRPSTTAATEEDSTEPARGRFTPKEPRHHPTREAIIPEKHVKAVNTRLRPFGRYRSTTATTTTTPRVSIKPNLFSARRRPTMVSLRSKILNKKANVTEATTTEESEVKTTTLSYHQEINDVPTTAIVKKETTVVEPDDEAQESTTVDIMKNESHIYSQRVSDLTSSSQNEYNTPGLFKNVSPTSSRRIPNYFTIATDDPILPIEAFFPNIKDKA